MYSSIPEHKDQSPSTRSHLAPANPTSQQQLSALWQSLSTTKDVNVLCKQSRQFSLLLVRSQDQYLFLQYFIEKRFLCLLHDKINEFRFNGELLKTVFSLFQFLLKALKKEEELIYFLVKISQEGFLAEEYHFEQEEDKAYYANFLKLMVRTINAQPKYLNVFYNTRQPHFPLLLQLLKMYDCQDSIMQASSQLAVLEISNNPSPPLQKYLANFPFVIFYPLYASRILSQLKVVLQSDDPLWQQTMQSTLRYLQDFVGKKQRVAVDMLTNSFFKVVGRYFYEQLSSIDKKNLSKTTRLLKTIYSSVLPEISVVKMKISLLCILSPLIPSQIMRCLQSKTEQLQRKFWIPDCCSQQVIDHCKVIFYEGERQSKSFLKSINSFIPRTKDNWLHHQMKKISDIVGYDIKLNEHASEVPKNGSMLHALQKMVDDEVIQNPILSSLLKADNEQLFFYYLKVLTNLSQLHQSQHLLVFEQIVNKIQNCTSFSLVQAFYYLTKNKHSHGNNQVLIAFYNKVTEKLLHFILTKGWKEFIQKTKEINLTQITCFQTDIYREIGCDILYFVSLRTLLGSPNQQSSQINLENWNFPSTLIQIVFKCTDGSPFGLPIYLILDGQFLNLKNHEQKLINRQSLPLCEIQLIEQEDHIELVASNYTFNLYLDPNLKNYFLKEVNLRKQITDKVLLQLKQMKFVFGQK